MKRETSPMHPLALMEEARRKGERVGLAGGVFKIQAVKHPNKLILRFEGLQRKRNAGRNLPVLPPDERERHLCRARFERAVALSLEVGSMSDGGMEI